MKISANVGMLIRAQLYYLVLFALPLDVVGILINLIKGRPQSITDIIFTPIIFCGISFAFLLFHYVRGYRIFDDFVHVPFAGKILRSSIVKTDRNPWGHKMILNTGRRVLVFFDTSKLNMLSGSI
jgi:hypothetical protein